MNDMTRPVISRAGRLPVLQRWSAYLLFLSCGGSGLAYLLGHEFEVMRALLADHSMLVAHGVSAALVLVLTGSILPTHFRIGLRTRRNLVTGLTVSAVLLALAISGWLLYYGTEAGRDAALWTHWVIGVLILALAPLHVLVGRSSAGAIR